MNVFQDLIAELEAAGWTVNKIAAELRRQGFDYQYIQIQRVKEGGRVVYPLDFLLAQLHTAQCEQSLLTIVPRPSAISMQMA